MKILFIGTRTLTLSTIFIFTTDNSETNFLKINRDEIKSFHFAICFNVLFILLMMKLMLIIRKAGKNKKNLYKKEHILISRSQSKKFN